MQPVDFTTPMAKTVQVIDNAINEHRSFPIPSMAAGSICYKLSSMAISAGPGVLKGALDALSEVGQVKNKNDNINASYLAKSNDDFMRF